MHSDAQTQHSHSHSHSTVTAQSQHAIVDARQQHANERIFLGGTGHIAHEPPIVTETSHNPAQVKITLAPACCRRPRLPPPGDGPGDGKCSTLEVASA